ncbi:MAG TPA: AMP-binding protein, partial [Pyrinomonadaceae bacterium]|nr:AMP-binding protein [Pyrinomonadaceae bacterium]
MSEQNIAIESILHEDRVFSPPHEFAQKAHVRSFEEYERMYAEAEADLEGFWASQAHNLHWFRHWDTILEWREPHAKWFVGGKINASYNCLDRHLSTWRRNKAAIIWEGEPGDQRTLTYQQLHAEVAKFANVLKKMGIKTGDRVALYMPLVPELAIAMLGCARIGATHTVIFGGFSADAVRDRINDCGCKLVVTADGGFRRGSEVVLKTAVDKAVRECPTVENVIVYQRTKS